MNVRNFTLDLMNCIRNLKDNKAPGPDNITNEILKLNGLRDVLLSLFNLCLRSGLVPSQWKRCILMPIPKDAKKDPLIPTNYRTISLISCIAKLYSSLINIRITKFCEDNNLLVEEQNGFRKNRSCMEHVFSLTSCIDYKLRNGGSAFVCFLDMKKAFDWINRDLLHVKLLEYEIGGNILESIKAMYDGSSASIKLNDTMTDDF